MPNSSLAKDLILEIAEKDPVSAQIITDYTVQDVPMQEVESCSPTSNTIICSDDVWASEIVQIVDFNLLCSGPSGANWDVEVLDNGNYNFTNGSFSNNQWGGSYGVTGNLMFMEEDNWTVKNEKYTVEFVVKKYEVGGGGAYCSFDDMDLPTSAPHWPDYGTPNCHSTKGRSLYCYPTVDTPHGGEAQKILIFDIAQGDGPYLYVRGPGKSHLGAFINSECGIGSNATDLRANVLDFLGTYKCFISPFIHSGGFHYEQTGNNTAGGLEYRSTNHERTLLCSYVNINASDSNVWETPGYKTDGYVGYRSGQWAAQVGNIMKCSIFSSQNAQLHTIQQPMGAQLAAYYTTLGWDMASRPCISPNGFTSGTMSECIKRVQNAWNYGGSPPQTNFLHENNEIAGSNEVSKYQVYFVNGTVLSSSSYNITTANYDTIDQNMNLFLITKVDSGQQAACRLRGLEVYKADLVVNSYTGQIQVPVYEDQTVYDWHYLEVLNRDESPVALNFYSQDLKEVTKRTGGFSKTFELPASNYNQRILRTLTGVGAERATDAIVWKKARIKANGVIVFKGFARIEHSKTGDGGSYSCHILEDPTAWPALLGNTKLCELLLPSHLKDWATIRASWDGTCDTMDYVYALASYGKWESNSNANHTLKDWNPAIYAKNIVKLIFNTIGYTVNSAFFETPEFETLVIPYTSGEIYADTSDLLGESGCALAQGSRAANTTVMEIDDCYCSPGCSGKKASAMPDLTQVHDNCGITPGNYNPTYPGSWSYGGGNQSWNGSSGYTVPFTGRYFVKLSGQQYTNHDATFKRNKTCWMWTLNNTHVNSSNNGFDSASCNNNSAWGRGNYTYAGGDSPSDPNGNGIHAGAPYNQVGSGACYFYGGDTGNNDWLQVGFEFEADFVAGDIIGFKLYGHNWSCYHDCEMHTKEMDFLVYPLADQNGAVPAVDVNLQAALPCGIKQKDFLKGLTDLFNLHWLTDDDSKQVWVEPYDDFYGAGMVQDWSKKIDKTNWKDKFLIDELAKDINFKYKTDAKDALVEHIDNSRENHTNSFRSPLWSYYLLPHTDMYRKGEITLGTKIFAPTMRIHSTSFNNVAVNTGDKTWTLSAGTGDGPIIPAFWKDPSNWGWVNGSDRPDTSYNFDIRIQNYYGKRSCNTWKQMDENAGLHTYTQYPYMDTMDMDKMMNSGPFADTKSLDWEDSTMGGLVSHGLFTKYYSRVFDKINGGVCIRTCKMNLTPNDISNFNYRDIIHLRIDAVSTYWTINKIKDYKPGKAELTTVELVEWKYGINSKQMRGGGGEGMGKLANPSGNVTGKATEFYSNRLLMPPLVGRAGVDAHITKGYSNANNEGNIPFQSTPLTIGKNKGLTLSNDSGNQISGDGIAMGYGLTANNGQMVVGHHNKEDVNSLFQVGNGYKDKDGRVIKQTVMSITKDGVQMFGGELVADFTVGDVTFTQDVYYKDSRGQVKKLYLKEKPKYRDSSEDFIVED